MSDGFEIAKLARIAGETHPLQGYGGPGEWLNPA